jgi:O-antigen ligase
MQLATTRLKLSPCLIAYGLLVVLAFALFVITQKVYCFALPLLLPIIYGITHYTALLLPACLAAIPFSKDVTVGGGFTIDAPDEPLMWLCTLWAVFYLAVNRKNLPAFITKDSLFFLCIIYLVWIALCISWSIQPFLSLKFFLAKFWYFIPFAVLTAIYFYKYPQQLLYSLVFAVAISACIIICYHAYLHFQFSQVNQAAGLFYTNHVNYATNVLAALPFAWYGYKQANSLLLKRLYRVALIIFAIAIITAFTRSVWLAIFVGFGALWLFKRKWLFISTLSSFILVAGFLFYLGNDNRFNKYAHDYNNTVWHANLSEHLQATLKGNDVSNAERFYRWIAGVRMAKQRLLYGHGPNTFYPEYKKYTLRSFSTWVSDNKERSTVHNYFLLLLIEQGLAGMLLFIGIILLFVYKLENWWHKTQHNAQSKQLGLAICFLFCSLSSILLSSDMLESDKFGPYFFMCFGLYWAIAYKKQKQVS